MSEQLGKEVGFYQDPSAITARLSSEFFRAVRLVVDTGLHAQGWTRDQVVAFFRQSGAVDEPTIQAETDRYVSWPAQALSYSWASSSSASSATALRKSWRRNSTSQLHTRC